MISVTLDGVTKVFAKSVPVLQSFDLHIEAGELIVLLGPSGCGKSTILRLIAGLETPTEGRILFDGEDVAGIPARARNVAMVQQDGALYGHFSARENIRFPLMVRKVPKADSDRDVEAEAAQLGIGVLLGRMPSELSAGHRHSVATARALVQKSRILLMDEPLATLDAQIRERTRLEIARLHQELETTMVYVTNDEREAMALGDRIVVLDEAGAVRQLGSPRDVYDRPASLFVAGFVGEMNHTTTRPQRDEQGWWLPIGSDRLLLDWAVVDAHPGLELFEDREVIVGWRPEHLAIAPPGTPFVSCLHGTVGRVEDAGSFVTAWVKVGAWILKTRLLVDRLPVPGNPIELTFDPGHLHFFDQGERI